MSGRVGGSDIQNRSRALAAVLLCAVAAVACSTSSNPVDGSSSSSAITTTTKPVGADQGRAASTSAAAGHGSTSEPTSPATTMSVPVSSVPVSSSAGDIAELVLRLPTSTDLPAGWEFEDGTPRVVFEPASGFYRGTCSGANADARAQGDGAWGVANGVGYQSGAGAWGYATVYGFPGDTEAQRFVEHTREVSACSQSGTVAEGDGPGEYDGFADPALDGKVHWSIAETARSEPEAVQAADIAIALVTDDTATVTSKGIEYSARLRDVTIVARFGKIVLVASLASYCCDTGYAQPAGTSAVSLSDLRPAMALFAKRVLSVGGAAGRS